MLPTLQPTRRPGRARWAGMLVALAVCATCLLASSGRAQPTVRVAVLPVVVHSVGNHGYLRDGLSDMLAARLARNGAVAVVRIDDPGKATTRPEEARALARELGADYALFGSFTRFGDGASLDIQCLKVSGDGDREPRAIFIQSGTLGQIIPRVDQLADKVVRYVSGSVPLAEASNGTQKGVDGEAAADAREALAQLEAVYERLEALEAAVYESQQKEVSESAPESPPANAREDAAESVPGPELSSARGDAPPLP